MTKEEALSKVKGYLTDYLPSDDYEEVEEIIKALEQKSTIKHGLGVDCISRIDALDSIAIMCSAEELNIDFAKLLLMQRAIKALPSATPIRPKGHWIEHPHEWGDNWQYSQYECSTCHKWSHFDTDFCPECGADMMEVEE